MSAPNTLELSTILNSGLSLSGVYGAVQCRWQVLLVGTVCVLYESVLIGLCEDWWGNPDYSHGFFVPPLSGYFIWRQRKELATLKRRPELSGLLFVVCTIGLLFLGSLGAELFLTRIAVVGTVDGLIVYFLGWNFLRALTFPVAFLFLMIPLPVNVYNEIVFPLRLLASCFARSVLDFVNFFPWREKGTSLYSHKAIESHYFHKSACEDV